MRISGAIAIALGVFVIVTIPSIFLIVPAWITIFPPSGKPDTPQIIPGIILGVAVGVYASSRCFRWLRSN